MDERGIRKPSISALIPLVALLLAARAAAAEPNAAEGQAVFSRACGICHAVEAGQNKVGPSLFGVVGRASASVPNYSYSEAMQNAHRTWDEAHLNTFLENPRDDVPGTKMIYPGLLQEDQRTNLIAYLRTLH